MVDTNATVHRLRQLKSLGVRLAIDDFGTGFSSLSYLRQFPVDILKIDRSFLTTATTSVQSAALVRTLVQLGDALGLDIIAEGIERSDQLRTLREAGCPKAQGFLFAQPMPKEKIDRLLRSGRLLLVGPGMRRRNGTRHTPSPSNIRQHRPSLRLAIRRAACSRGSTHLGETAQIRTSPRYEVKGDPSAR